MITAKHEREYSTQLIVDAAEQTLRNVSLPDIQEYEQDMGYDSYLREFRTVRIGMPRRGGHTTAALQLIVTHPDSLMFVNHESEKNAVLRKLCEYTDNPDIIEKAKECIVPIYNPNRILRLRPQPHRDFIVFDQSTVYAGNAIDSIMHQVQASVFVILQ